MPPKLHPFGKLLFRVSQNIGQWRGLKGHAQDPVLAVGVLLGAGLSHAKRPRFRAARLFVLPPFIERDHVVVPSSAA